MSNDEHKSVVSIACTSQVGWGAIQLSVDCECVRAFKDSGDISNRIDGGERMDGYRI
jgi:hypothetical protein